MYWKQVADEMTKSVDALFLFLKLSIRDLEKKYTTGGWFNKVGFDNEISCQDVYMDWFFAFLKYHNIIIPDEPEVSEDRAWAFVTESSGELIMFPVLDHYRNQIETNPFAKDIIKIWNMGDDLDSGELKKDHKNLFKKEIQKIIKRWEGGD